MKESNNTLRVSFIKALRSLYDAELIFYKRLPELKALTHSANDRDFIDGQIREKKKQLQRLEGIFAVLNQKPGGGNDEVVQYITTAFKQQPLHPELSQEILIKLNRVVSSHLINAYQSAIVYAVQLKHDVAMRILRRSFQREKEIARQLEALEACCNRTEELIACV
jgi:ferritin-like metal-binding protein YciE